MIVIVYRNVYNVYWSQIHTKCNIIIFLEYKSIFVWENVVLGKYNIIIL